MQLLKCEEVMLHVHDFLQKELSDEEMDKIFHHLDICLSCQSKFTFEDKLNKTIVEICDGGNTEDLKNRVAEQLRKLIEGHDPEGQGLAG